MSDHRPFNPPTPTAPQPEVQLSQQQVIGALERGQLALLDRIAALEGELDAANKHVEIIQASRSEEAAHVAALEASNGNAFVEGAKWWEWQKSNATMFQSDQQAAAEEAKRREYDFRPSMETFLAGKLTEVADELDRTVKRERDGQRKVAALEGQLAEDQARLAMAVEALKESDMMIWKHHEVGHIERAAHRPWGKACEICSKESPTIFGRNQAVLEATAPAVAEFVERVERRGAEKERSVIGAWLRSYAQNPKWSDPEVQHFAGHAAEYIEEGWYVEARAAELEGK